MTKKQRKSKEIFLPDDNVAGIDEADISNQ